MFIEKHPFEEFIPADTTTLIVGSFPPVKLTVKNLETVSGSNKIHYQKYLERYVKTNSDLDFYYGSSENSFWDLVGISLNITGKLDSVTKIETFLKEHKIGITDIVQECCRKSSSGGIGSLDSDLKIIKYRDVVTSILENNIRKVLCTSSFVHKKLDMQINKSGNPSIKDIVAVLPSPSRSFYRSARRLSDYNPPNENSKKYADEYRLRKYRELFN